jgi:hypothetical protein
MAQIVHETSGTVDGVWFLDEGRLKELDAVVDGIWANFRNAKKNDVQSEFNKLKRMASQRYGYEKLNPEQLLEQEKTLKKEAKNHYTLIKETRSIEITFASKKTLKGERFADVLTAPEVPDAMPSGLTVNIEHGRCQFELRIDLEGSMGDTVRASVTSNRPTLAAETYAKLKSWAEESRQSIWQLRWRRFAGLQWVLFFLVLLMSGIVLQFYNSVNAKEGESVKPEARRLLEGGLKKGSTRIPVGDFAPPMLVSSVFSRSVASCQASANRSRFPHEQNYLLARRLPPSRIHARLARPDR